MFHVREGFFIFVIFQINATILSNKLLFLCQHKHFIIKIDPIVNAEKSKFKRYFFATQIKYNQLKKINV